ncbi:MAG: hypothetical protein ACT4QD_15780 [Acidobacteriota bacterium]
MLHRLPPGVLVLWLLAACGDGGGTAPAVSVQPAAPTDPAHQNVTGPHGDHTPHHGGLVLMNGDVHYEVVLGRDGRHEVWFTDAVRRELPASVASGVTLEVVRPGEPAELVTLQINDTGEAWVARSRPIAGENVMLKLRYALTGEPYEIELPFVARGLTPS